MNLVLGREQTEPVPALTWHHSLAAAIRDPRVLIEKLNLPSDLIAHAQDSAKLFPFLAPLSFVARMQVGDVNDPLLRQILPLKDEFHPAPGFTTDAVGDEDSRRAPGLLHKYQGRALMIATGACAIHCRYCFRRHYPYANEPRRLEEWDLAFDVLMSDPSIHEVLLSGGDPMMLTDVRLGHLIDRLASIPHLKRLRIHSRLPIVLPDRVTSTLTELLTGSRLTSIMVVHANHPNEVALDCKQALRRLVKSGITTLNQAVLLRGVNDNVDTLVELNERLIDLGVIPYYLHQLDRVQGTAHFEVDELIGRSLIAEAQKRLPGYAVPKYVREQPGADHKILV